MYYNISEENGTAAAFTDFIIDMIANKFLRHNEVVIMDNARVHTGKDANTVEDLLWNHVVDGTPLRIVVVYLPTQSPELNPIELVFHILSRRVRSYRYQCANAPDSAVLRTAAKVMDDIDHDLVYRTMRHCGYYEEDD